MVEKQPNTPSSTSDAIQADTVCTADRMQRRHCAYYHEKTGRCTQNTGTTWQERRARDAGAAASEET